MRVLFSLGLLILAVESTAAILLGQNRCTWGPSYWCTHLGTVKECSSVGYCGRIWRTAAAPSSGQRGGSGSLSDANGDCGFCRLLASDLQRLTLSNRTASPAETQRLAASACGLVPEPRHRSICLAIVSNYMPEIVALFRDGLPADRLCPALSLCGTGRRDPRLTAAAAAAETPLLLRGEPVVPGAPARRPNLAASATRLSGEFCDLCVELVSAVKQAAQRQSTIAEVAQAMKTEVCARLGGSQSLCNMWVDTYLPEVMRSLAAKIEPKQICTGIKFCQSAAAANGKLQPHPLMQLMLLQRTAQKPLKDVECQVCEMLVSEARQMIRDNRTQEEIIEFVKNRVCNLVPAEKDKCIRAVTEYGPIIFQLLASELDPNTVCQALGACGKTDSTAAPRRARIGPQCVLCEYIIRELDQMLGSNRTEEAIQSALESVCSIMPQTLRTDCDAWVRQYTPIVLQLLSQDLNPAMVCSVMGLCAGDSERLLSSSTVLASTTGCDICQTVILYVKSLLKENATEKEVMDVLEKVCNFMPTQEQSACRSFIEQYTPYIIQLLMQDVDPKQICQTIGLCPKSSAAAFRASLRYRANDMVEMRRREEPLI
ncbi:hypothetical protein BOX15_Mlig011638g1 [Macrostomum lignano]|uniref:Pulmonary surfactant-associated protein B n=1 Tax=Macrostomum lignano TaxID=282301 RepID=A0A267FH96_9PLAT|nr:hypothetical protein BOX15_Mlig011638g1 [Macrostomum lignano]